MEIVYLKSKARIGSVSLDASIHELHDFSADIAEHAVEDGPDIADHYRPKLPSFRIEGLISNTPLAVPDSQAEGVREVDRKFEWKADPDIPLIQVGGPGPLGMVTGAIASAVGADVQSATARGFEPEFDRVGDCLTELRAIIDEQKIVQIVTALVTYDNMMMTSLQVDRDKNTGNALRFTAIAKQIKVVSTASVAGLPHPVIERGKPKRSRGKQPTKTAETGSAEANKARQVNSGSESESGLHGVLY